ncbi:MAG: response regulator transcription factor [Candidatus Kapabacteria bacterium]|nr:response regulator transcription factor [Candidatus Kapabacteria bacterium]
MSGRNSTKTVRIVLADDHELVRVGVRRLLLTDSNIEIVGEAGSGDEAVYLTQQEKPDIVFLDVLMPNLNGIDAAKKIKSESDKTRVVMLTTFEDQYYLDQALQSGADGYLSKEINRRELIDAVNQVMHGERVFSKAVLALMQGKTSVQSQQAGTLPIGLTKREEEILHLVAQGLTSQEIANKLFISPRTVETHRAHLMDKLGVNNTAGLVRFAFLHSSYFSRTPVAS